MTDNRTTELREKLTERGIDYEVKDLPNIKFFHDTRWNANGVYWCYTEFVGATTCLTMCNEWKDCTPEQAIAATLGAEPSADATDALELLDEIRSGDRICYDDYSRLFDAIATLGSGTCEFIPTTDNPPTCSNCGWQADAYDCDWLDCGTYEYDGRFCKNCGARVEGGA